MTFDPEQFAATEFSGSFEEDYTPVPDGEWTVVIEDAELVALGEAGRPALKLHYRIMEPLNEEVNEMPVNDTVWLDMNEQGSLREGKNKNLQLGRFLSAVNLNGKPWRVDTLIGRTLTIRTQLEPDRKDPEQLWPRVKAYARG